MPFTWMSFSTMSSPAIEGKTPHEIYEVVLAIAERNEGCELENVYFDVGREVAYALFKNLGDSVATKQASRELGGIGYTKMLDWKQAHRALTGEEVAEGS